MEVTNEQLAGARADGALILDVREPFQYVQGHVPGARLVPLGEVPSATSDLPKGQPIYVVCASGNRSLRATQLLRGAGLDAYSVRGGTKGWIDAGRPVVTGTHADES